MGARQKLNGIMIQACLIVGGLIGLVFQSWLVFFSTAVVLLGLNLYGGEIRPSSRRTSASARRSFHNRSHRSSRATTRRR